jgi:L,D-peptidoglycan transpeptidase YkuD (ErfK/YbiS/YcfS/YnhG family)
VRRVLVVISALAAGLLVPPPAQADTVTLDGVRVRVGTRTTQVVTVNHTRGYRARLVLWSRTSTGWHRRLESTGRVGYGGLVAGSKRDQGTGTTPLGTYRLLSSFGTHRRQPGWDLAHRVIGSGDYWVQDNRSRYYNRYRNSSQGGFRWWLPTSNDNSSERLRRFAHQYEYAILTGFNYTAQVRHRGAGIFLHVNGKGATAGCVSAPRRVLRALMNRLDPTRSPVIAIGR